MFYPKKLTNFAIQFSIFYKFQIWNFCLNQKEREGDKESEREREREIIQDKVIKQKSEIKMIKIFWQEIFRLVDFIIFLINKKKP